MALDTNEGPTKVVIEGEVAQVARAVLFVGHLHAKVIVARLLQRTLDHF